MIRVEFFMKRYDGIDLYRTYSDAGYYIERDGIRYEEAIDPEASGRVYTETNELIPVSEEDEPEIQNGNEETINQTRTGRALGNSRALPFLWK